MIHQTLTIIPSRARIVAINNHKEKIEVTYCKVNLKQQRIFAALPTAQKHQLKKHLNKLHLMGILDLQNWYGKRKQGLSSFKMDAETYEEFKKRKLKEADEQI